VNSLQKIMTNITNDSTFSTYTSNNTDPSTYDPREYSYNGFYDDTYKDNTNMYYKKVRTSPSALNQQQNQGAMYPNLMLAPVFNRAATPTKDELYPSSANLMQQQQQQAQPLPIDMMSSQHAMYPPYTPHYGLTQIQQTSSTVPPPPPGPPPLPPPPPPPHGITSDPTMYGYLQPPFPGSPMPMRPNYEYHKPGPLGQLMSNSYQPPHFMSSPSQHLRPPFLQSPQASTPTKSWNFNEHLSNNIDLSMNNESNMSNEPLNRRKPFNDSKNSNSNAQFRFNKGNVGQNPQQHHVHQHQPPYHHNHHHQHQQHPPNFNQKSYQIQTINSNRDQKSPYNPPNHY
jgi:hypothetical protein